MPTYEKQCARETVLYYEDACGDWVKVNLRNDGSVSRRRKVDKQKPDELQKRGYRRIA